MDPLRLGSVGPEVAELQKKLTQLGLFSSTISKTFDVATEKAAIVFQKQYPWLIIDGVVGDMTLGEINDAISEIDGQIALEAFASSSNSLNMTDLNKQPLLCLAVQRKLRGLGLYPGGKLVDGAFGSKSQTALKELSSRIGSTVSNILQLEPITARKLLDTPQISSVLEEAKNSKTVLANFNTFQKNVKADDSKLGFLDMGAQFSPFKKSVHQHADFLTATKAAGIKTSTPTSLSFSLYPDIGYPPFNFIKLEFLDSAITEACICIGLFNGSALSSSWLGRKETTPVECLSATKIIPILNVLCQIGSGISSLPQVLILKGIEEDDLGNSIGEVRSELSAMFIDICSYREGVPLSNSRSATLNKFEAARPEWIRKQTGNPEAIKFNGSYGGNKSKSLASPKIFNGSSNATILNSKSTVFGGNSISVYDLTRLMSLVGWHQLLSDNQQLPGISDRGIEQIVTALGTDTARYVDTAFSTLGLENVISSLIVLSKMGYGNSALIYTTFVQFIDKQDPNKPMLRTFSMTLRAKKTSTEDDSLDVRNKDAVRVDTAIATAVTEIIRRIVTDDFKSPG
jgi:peptidoglycan hydrolase-like protein with peptidoglycan-binding domain